MSSFVPVSAVCDICFQKHPGWIYRYRGRIYCRQCFNDHFEIKQCSKCGESKYIWYQHKEKPLCKICEIKDDPCIRCGKEIKRFGKIVEYGPVCASCSKYYREKRQCMVCYKYSREVFNREIDGSVKPACTSCYNKTLPSCSRCQRKKIPHTFSLDRKPVCEKCSGEDRVCKGCGEAFPAGRGRICQECSSRNGLKEKVLSSREELSTVYGDHFAGFASWLCEKRGAPFASNRILSYLPWFKELDGLEKELGRAPTYADIVSAFSVAKTRQYLLVTRYFDDKGIIPVDKEAQKIHADLDMIGRYLSVFKKQSEYHRMILSYYEFLEEKHDAGKMSIRSMRLALTPAVRFLQYCGYGKEEKPSQRLLESYLWCFYGQKNAISAFILFLNREFDGSFSLRTIHRPVLERPKSSQKYLEQRFISLLRRKDVADEKGHETLLRVAIGYLHGVNVPRYVKLGFCNIKKGKDGYYVRLAGKAFSLSMELTWKE